MVVVYKLHWLTYWIVRWLSKARYISLPNLLANEALVPELVQKKQCACHCQSDFNWLNDTVKIVNK
jgi:lipid-A-disaccharide synthase